MSSTSQKKSSLELFLVQPSYAGLPADRSILRRDRKQRTRLDKKNEELQAELEEVRAPLLKSRLERLGLSLDDAQALWEAEREMAERYQEEFAELPKILDIAHQVEGIDLTGELRLCRQVIVWECQQRICVDHPVPITIDACWYDVDGNFTWMRQCDRFTLGDSVSGNDDWNFTGHHRTGATHEGEVEFRAGATLVEPATIRQVGVQFVPLPGAENGGYVTGDDGPLPGADSGTAKRWASLQVLVKRPGGSWEAKVPTSSVEANYYSDHNDSGRPPAGPPFAPPIRSVDLDEQFPQGTEFVLEIALRYYIRGWGYWGSASVSYGLEVQPYMNLEACSWQWPA